jgi:hypothetical protein
MFCSEKKRMEIPRKKENAVFTFGRFQPPTKGHGVLIKEVERLAKEVDADGFVFVSSSIIQSKYFTSKKFYAMMESGKFESSKDNENPLNVATKVEFLKKMYPDTNVTFVDTTVCDCKTLPSILKKLQESGYKQIQMVVGSDRVNTFKKVVNIPVLAAGETRNLTGKATSGNLKTVSGTKMRVAAVKENFNTFRNGVKQGDMTNDNVRVLMKKIRDGLGYKNEPKNAGSSGGGKTRKGKRGSKRFRQTLRRK